MLFIWYSQITVSSFSVGVRFIYNSFKNWQWFLSEGVGGSVVQAAFGSTLAYSGVAQRLEFVFSWLTILLVSIGLLAALGRFIKVMIAKPNAKHGKPSFLPDTFEAEYLMLSAACYLLLVATVILPNVSEGYGSTRVYLQMTTLLSVFFVIGGITVARYLKSRPHWILLAVLIPYLLSTTGVTTQVFGFPRAITLNSEGPLYDDMYISDAESRAAKWVKEYADREKTIYVKGNTRHILWSQGKIPFSKTDPSLISHYEKGREFDGYIYLRNLELVDGGLPAEYPDIFADKSKIYANGDSEVYK